MVGNGRFEVARREILPIRPVVFSILFIVVVRRSLPLSLSLPIMLSRTLRSSSAAGKRSYATVSTPVVSFNHGQPTASVTVVVKAGPRYESKPGVAHCLKNFAFKVGRKEYTLLLRLIELVRRTLKSDQRCALSVRRSFSEASSRPPSRENIYPSPQISYRGTSESILSA